MTFLQECAAKAHAHVREHGADHPVAKASITAWQQVRKLAFGEAVTGLHDEAKLAADLPPPPPVEDAK